MKRTLWITAVICCSLAMQSYAQSSKIDPQGGTTVSQEINTPAGLKELLHKLEGTFRVEYSQAEYKILYTADLLQTIEANRRETEEYRLQWDDYTVVVIYPKIKLASIENQSKN